MERVPIVKTACSLALVACVLAGCGSQASVSAQEEENYKHPKKVDLSKIPPINFKRSGPSFIGQPSGATGSTAGGPGGARTPAAPTEG